MKDAMGAALELLAVGQDARSAWQQLAGATRPVRPTQTPAWLDCMRAVGPYEDATRLYETPDGRYVVLPLVRHRGVPARTPVEYSWPEAWGYGGPLPSGDVRAADIAGLAADLSRRRVVRTAVRVILREDDFRLWESAVPTRTWRQVRSSHVLDLSGGFDTVWTERFSSKVRSASRKAVRRGVQVESDTSGRLIPVFDVLYRRSVARWAAERHEPTRLRQWLAARREPQTKFATVAARLGESCQVWIAFHDDRPVAGILVVAHGDQVLYWRGAMDKERVAGTGANELLHRCAIERACQRGAQHYDMGISPSVSLARFKRSFGATEAHAVEYRFERLPLSAAEKLVRSAVQRTVRSLPS